MKATLQLIFVLTICCFTIAKAQDSDYRKGELIVMINHNSDIQLVCEKLNKMYSGYNYQAHQKLGVSMNIWLIKFHESANHSIALQQIRSLDEVALAQYNHKIELRSIMPNDPSFSSQWSLLNTGQSGGTVGADISALQAWDITTGGLTATGDTIVAAVIDGGNDLNHPDLDYFKNYHEIPANGIDDDNNGYVDDVSGWSAYSNTGTVTSSSHGTHVSGTIGALGNNNLGVTGVNWNMKIMPIQGSSGNEATVVIAYSYVYEMRKLYNLTDGAKGAYIVSTNASFGVDYGQPSNFPIWCAMYDSLGTVGVLNCGAGPNLNVNIDVVGDIPTACPGDFIISVTNTTRSDLKNSGAGYGVINMDIGAPGSSILSTTPNASYGNSTGTSMATPHVTGAIALMYAAACSQMIQDSKSNPSLVAIFVRNFLLNAVDSIPSMAGIVSSHGRLNLFKSLLNVQTYQCLPTYSPELSLEKKPSVYPNPFNSELWYRPAFKVDSSDLIKIIDLTGRTVQIIEKKSLQTEDFFFQISTEFISPGIFFIVHERSGKHLSTSKIIKH